MLHYSIPALTLNTDTEQCLGPGWFRASMPPGHVMCQAGIIKSSCESLPHQQSCTVLYSLDYQNVATASKRQSDSV